MSSWKAHLTVLGMLVAVVAAVSFVDLTRHEGNSQGVIAWFVAMGFVLYAAITTGVTAIFRLDLRGVVAVHLVPVSVAFAVAGSWYTKQRPAPVEVVATAAPPAPSPAPPQLPRFPGTGTPITPESSRKIDDGPYVLGEFPPPKKRPKMNVAIQSPGYESQIIDGAKLGAYIRSRKGALQQCLEKYEDTPSGSLVLRFKITPAGRTTAIEVEKTTAESEMALKCIKVMLQGWVFPFKPPNDTPVMLPLKYEAQPGTAAVAQPRKLDLADAGTLFKCGVGEAIP